MLISENRDNLYPWNNLYPLYGNLYIHLVGSRCERVFRYVGRGIHLLPIVGTA